MEKNIPWEETGVEVGQKAFQRFVENFSPTELESKKFTEKIWQYFITEHQGYKK